MRTLCFAFVLFSAALLSAPTTFASLPGVYSNDVLFAAIKDKEAAQKVKQVESAFKARLNNVKNDFVGNQSIELARRLAAVSSLQEQLATLQLKNNYQVLIVAMAIGTSNEWREILEKEKLIDSGASAVGLVTIIQDHQASSINITVEVEQGSFSVGDMVRFGDSSKKFRIDGIGLFGAPDATASAGAREFFQIEGLLIDEFSEGVLIHKD